MIRRDKLGRFKRGNNSGQRFSSGQKVWNKGLKGIHLSPSSEFKEGEGMEKSASWKGGVHQMTKDCIHIMVASNVRKRRPRLLWEQYHKRKLGKLVIYHLNGNNHDDCLENLEAITRKELRRRNLIKSWRNRHGV